MLECFSTKYAELVYYSKWSLLLMKPKPDILTRLAANKRIPHATLRPVNT